MNKYLIISLSVIVFIGSYSIFNAGYNTEGQVEEETAEGVEEEVEETVEDENGGEEEREESTDNNKDENDEEEIEQSGLKEADLKKTPADFGADTFDCLYSLSGIPAPKQIAINSKDKEVWVSSLRNKESGLFIIDMKSGELKKRINLSDEGGVEIIFGPEEEFGYISQMETGRVFEIDTNSKQVKRTFSTHSSWSKGMAIDESRLYVTNWSGGDVSVIDLDSGELIERFPTATTPRGIYVDENIYVAGFDNGEIKKHNRESDQSQSLILTGGAMRDLIGTEDYVYGSDMASGAVYRVDKETQEVGKFLKTHNNPNSIRLTEDEKILAVSNRGINHPSGNYHIPGPEWGSIIFYDTETGNPVDFLKGGNQPTGLDISQNYLIYSNFLDGEIVVCESPKSSDLVGKDPLNLDDYREKLKK